MVHSGFSQNRLVTEQNFELKNKSPALYFLWPQPNKASNMKAYLQAPH